MRFSHVLTIFGLCCPLLLAAGTPTLERPLPEQWQYASDYSMELPTDDPWWQTFGDQTLDSLIALGEKNNYDLLQAAHRIEIARQGLRQIRAQYMPTLSFSGGWSKARTSGMTTSRAMSASTIDYFSIGVDMSWQIDLFGKITAQAREKKAVWQATRAEYVGGMVSVAANIATAYIQLRTLQSELLVAQAHIASQERVVKITEARHEAALASGLDVAQALTIYYSTQASVASLQTSIAQTINSIGVLLGVYPGELDAWLGEPKDLPDYHHMVAVGVPMELLRRRPDIIEAEYTLASYAAAVGIAKKEFLPTLTLTGSIGTEAHNGKDLFKHNSLTYAIAPTLSWTIFDGMARSAAVASARQQMEIGIENYNLTVLTAVQEVDNALTAYHYDLQYIATIEKVVEQAQRSFDLSLDQYKSGLSSFTNVADAQITLLEYADELVSARGQALTALVTLYQALGGGFQLSLK
ncbi:MAG: efflux transporter outer membrane subunit [Bacteroidales bacterium]|nr:efflux transporter outer membrane subunit [Bacteroidales bacterium]